MRKRLVVGRRRLLRVTHMSTATVAAVFIIIVAAFIVHRMRK